MRCPMAIYKRFIQFRCEGHRGFMAASGSHRRSAPVTAHQFTSYLSFCRISACMTIINKTRDASARRRSLSDRSHRRSARVSVKPACIASCYYIFAPCSWQPATGEGHLIAQAVQCEGNGLAFASKSGTLVRESVSRPSIVQRSICAGRAPVTVARVSEQIESAMGKGGMPL
jgi:hypothetical protein